MQEATPDQEADDVAEPVVDFEGECPSLTGRSVLTYQVGRNPTDPSAEIVFRIARNSGKGMWCKDWAPVTAIDAVLTKSKELSARTFNEVHPGKSINTGGFILAVLKDLGVVKAKEESRHHERVPGATLMQALIFKAKEAAALDKHKKAKAG